MVLGVVDDDVGSHVEDLKAFGAYLVERLARGVDREGYEASCGVVGRVGEVAYCVVGLGVEKLDFVVVGDEGGAMVAADVEEEIVGVRLARGVAVNAAVWNLCVLKNGVFGERGKVPLVDAHLAVDLIAWLDATVGETICREGVGAHVYREGAILSPSVGEKGADGNGETVGRGGEEGMPLVDIEIGFQTIGCESFAVGGYGDIDALDGVARHGEVEWGDGGGDCDAHVVWPYGRECVDGHDIVRTR